MHIKGIHLHGPNCFHFSFLLQTTPIAIKMTLSKDYLLFWSADMKEMLQTQKTMETLAPFSKEKMIMFTKYAQDMTLYFHSLEWGLLPYIRNAMANGNDMKETVAKFVMVNQEKCRELPLQSKERCAIYAKHFDSLPDSKHDLMKLKMAVDMFCQRMASVSWHIEFIVYSEFPWIPQEIEKLRAKNATTKANANVKAKASAEVKAKASANAEDNTKANVNNTKTNVTNVKAQEKADIKDNIKDYKAKTKSLSKPVDNAKPNQNKKRKADVPSHSYNLRSQKRT